MKIIALICNVLFWVFFWLVLATDGPPEENLVMLLVFPLGMPVVNVVVLRLLASPGRRVKIAALLGNALWLAISCWAILTGLPGHPKEAGLVEFAALMALTPLLSAIAIALQLRPGRRVPTVPRDVAAG